MNARCLECGAELELPDSMCENGMHFRCYQCSTRFSYFDGRLFELKEESPARIHVPQQRNESSDSYVGCSQRKATTHQAELNFARRIGQWWRRRSSMSKRVYLIGGAVLCAVVLLCICGRGGTENKLDVEWKRLQKIEAKYGTNSVEYVEARLGLVRKFFTLAKRTGLVEKHRTFMKALDRAGYMVMNQKYSDHTLVSLLVVDKNTGDCGFMRSGMSENEFSYPNWLSAKDAQMIWGHFYLEAMNGCESRLADTEKLIDDLETQLRHLKSAK